MFYDKRWFSPYWIFLLVHLSRRLIGELLVYRGIRSPPSSTFSNDFFSEAEGPILLIFHI